MMDLTYEHVWAPVRPREDRGTSLGRALRARAYSVFRDETLVRQALRRDQAAFDALLARYRKRLHSVTLGSLGDDGRADPLCELVFSAFRDIDAFSEKCSPGTWLYTHGLRAVFDRCAKRRPD